MATPHIRRRRELKNSLLVHSVLGEVLSVRRIEDACRSAGHVSRAAFWSPATTVLTFLCQVLSAEKTLRAAVGDLLAQHVASGRNLLPSPDPAAYCQARQRLPGEVLLRLLGAAVEAMKDLPQSTSIWLGRRVWIVDGTTVSMPDEPELREAFPAPPGQPPGCAFPVARIVALFCRATGAIIDIVIDSLRSHELPLFRKLGPHFRPGDVVVGDRAYCSYVDVACLWQQGVHWSVRLHPRREADFRVGQRLGPDDRLVTWVRPRQWSESMGIRREAFERLPETMTVRLVRIRAVPRGFRSPTVVVVTTLLDPIETPADAIRALYRDRWLAELNLRSIKTQLGMDILRGRSMDVVCKEIAMHLLAYNLIRLLMWQAAREHGRDLHRLSFTGALHRLRDLFPLIVRAKNPTEGLRLVEHLLRWIATDRVPARPDRVEPRRRKRRPRRYDLLTRPRGSYYPRVPRGSERDTGVQCHRSRQVPLESENGRVRRADPAPVRAAPPTP